MEQEDSAGMIVTALLMLQIVAHRDTAVVEYRRELLASLVEMMPIMRRLRMITDEAMSIPGKTIPFLNRVRNFCLQLKQLKILCMSPAPIANITQNRLIHRQTHSMAKDLVNNSP